jgi:hypothetical protein
VGAASFAVDCELDNGHSRGRSSAGRTIGGWSRVFGELGEAKQTWLGLRFGPRFLLRKDSFGAWADIQR